MYYIVLIRQIGEYPWIKRKGDDWLWLKSPWDEGRLPMYNTINEYRARITKLQQKRQ